MRRFLVLVFLLLAAGCGGQRASGGGRTVTPPAPAASATPFRPLPPTATVVPTATPTPSPTPTPPAVWLPPGLPWRLEGWALASAPEQATVWLNLRPQQAEGVRMFVLAVPAFTWAPWVSTGDLMAHWRGDAPSPLGEDGLLMTEETLAWLQAAWGEPAPSRVQVAPREALLQEARNRNPGWTLLPMDELTPDWRAVPIDGQVPLLRPFTPEAYPLAFPFAWEGPANLAAAWREQYSPANWYPKRLTVVALTGVTALVRATAFTMEVKGLTYPAQDVGPILRAADITHINNEVPFDPTCPPPNPYQRDLRFCSDPRYIRLLEEVGTDVVELAGDHFNDRGPQAVLYTLEMYRERGWAYYGGGANREDALKPARFEHNGNRISFLGCNAKGGGYATASATRPGAVACDWPTMTRLVRAEREAGFLPIVTFQHQEIYMFDPPEGFKQDFRRMVEAGAVIVSGSQAHHPHGMERYRDGFIHYGLGNLFFDQKGVVPGGDWGFIDLHVFYQGRYVGMQPVLIRFVDFARPEVLSWEEARPYLEQVYAVSRWR